MKRKAAVISVLAVLGFVCMVATAQPKLSLHSTWGTPNSVTLYSFGNLFGVFIVNDGLRSHFAIADHKALKMIENTLVQSKFWKMSEEEPLSDPRYGGNDTDRIRMAGWQGRTQHVVVKPSGELGGIADVANLVLRLARTQLRYKCS